MEIYWLKDSLYYSNDHFLVSLKFDGNYVIELPLREYLLGVLATNLIIGVDIEVIKAICILFRTYAFYSILSKQSSLLDRRLLIHRFG